MKPRYVWGFVLVCSVLLALCAVKIGALNAENNELLQALLSCVNGRGFVWYAKFVDGTSSEMAVLCHPIERISG